MYDPVIHVKDKKSKKIIYSLIELEAGILYCLLEGLIQKDIHVLLCCSRGNIKKRMGIMYDKVDFKFRTVGILLGWTFKNEIYSDIIALAKKNGLAKKVAAFKKTIPCIFLALLNFLDGLMELIAL